jgi:hypothetical protein
LLNRTPALMWRAVPQWSPLHFFVLFSITAGRIPPSVSCQPTR